MKKLCWAAVGLLCVLIGIYGIREMNPEIRVGATMEITEPTVFFVDDIVEVNAPLKVAKLGYPSDMQYSYEWKVDGKQIENHTDTYVLTQEDLQKFVSVTVIPDDKSYQPQTLSFFFSDLPVMNFVTDDGEMIESKTEYKAGTLKIQGNTRYSDASLWYDGRMQIKGRGNSTWNNSDKGPYHLKLDVDANLFGLGKENDWTLLSNPFDGTLMKNVTAYELSGLMGLTYMESVYVDVVVNGQYLGNYQLCEKIEVAEDRVDITNWEQIASDAAELMLEAGMISWDKEYALKQQLKSDLSWLSTGKFVFEDKEYDVPHYVEIPERTGGVLLELDMYWDEISKFRVENQHFMYNEPKYAATNTELFEYIKEYVANFYYSAYVEFSGDYLYENNGVTYHYADLFDMDSLVAYWLLQEIYFNADGMGMSSFFYKDVDGPAYMGPIWDMDRGANGLGQFSYLHDEWQTRYYSMYDQCDQWYKGLIGDPYFLSQAKKCWDNYHDQIFSLIADDGMIDQIYEYIQNSGRADNALWEKEVDFDTEVYIFQMWMEYRLAWLDEQFADLDTLVASLGKYNYGIPSEMSCENGRITISCSGSDAVEAVWYFNGKIYGTTPVEGGKTYWDIPEGMMSEEADVIQVRIYDGTGKLIASNYMDNRIVKES